MTDTRRFAFEAAMEINAAIDPYEKLADVLAMTRTLESFLAGFDEPAEQQADSPVDDMQHFQWAHVNPAVESVTVTTAEAQPADAPVDKPAKKPRAAKKAKAKRAAKVAKKAKANGRDGTRDASQIQGDPVPETGDPIPVDQAA